MGGKGEAEGGGVCEEDPGEGEGGRLRDAKGKRI